MNPGSEWKWKLPMAGSKANWGSERKWKFQVAVTKWIQVVNESESCTRQVVKVANPGSFDKMNTGIKWKRKLHKAGNKSC